MVEENKYNVVELSGEMEIDIMNKEANEEAAQDYLRISMPEYKII